MGPLKFSCKMVVDVSRGIGFGEELDGRTEHLKGSLIKSVLVHTGLVGKTHDVFVLPTAQSTIPISVSVVRFGMIRTAILIIRGSVLM